MYLALEFYLVRESMYLSLDFMKWMVQMNL